MRSFFCASVLAWLLTDLVVNCMLCSNVVNYTVNCINGARKICGKMAGGLEFSGDNPRDNAKTAFLLKIFACLMRRDNNERPMNAKDCQTAWSSLDFSRVDQDDEHQDGGLQSCH